MKTGGPALTINVTARENIISASFNSRNSKLSLKYYSGGIWAANLFTNRSCFDYVGF